MSRWGHGRGQCRCNAGTLQGALVAEEDCPDHDYDVRIVKVQGEFTWHKHPDTDEFFLVLDGELKIQMRECNVALRPPELLVMPRGAEHCPSADPMAVSSSAVVSWLT
jgi:mannose-6-phosphate isomerase-like protein (cupin superfamily)